VWFVGVLLALIALTALSRWPLVREGLWRDEALGAFIAQSPSLKVFFDRSRISDYNPPLFNGLIAVWGSIAGFEERSLKVFALLWGLAAVGGVALLATELFGRPAGLISAVAASTNPILIGLSAELRPYSLSVVLATVSLTLVLRLRLQPGDRPRRLRWIPLSISLALLAYSHLAGVLVAMVVGMVGILISIRPRTRRFGIGLAASATIAGLAFLPWLPTSLRQSQVGLPWESHLSPGARWTLLLDRTPEVVPLVGMVMISAMAALIGYPPARVRLREKAFGFRLIGACGLSVLLTLGSYSPSSRYLVIPAALFAVLVGGALALAWDSVTSSRLSVRVVGIAGVSLFLIGTLLVRIPLYLDIFERDRLGLPKSGVRTLCRDHHFVRDDVVLVAPDHLALTVWYYCKPEPSLHGFVRWENPNLFDPRGYPELWASPTAVPRTWSHVARELEAKTRARFYLVWDSESDAPPLFYSRRVNALRQALSERYSERESTFYAGRFEHVGFTDYGSLTSIRREIRGNVPESEQSLEAGSRRDAHREGTRRPQ